MSDVLKCGSFEKGKETGSMREFEEIVSNFANGLKLAYQKELEELL